MSEGIGTVCYYVAAARPDGALPKPAKAVEDRLFFDAADAAAYIQRLAPRCPDVRWVIVEASIEPVALQYV